MTLPALNISQDSSQ